MKYGSFILLIFCLTSCKYFDKRKVNSEELLIQELKSVNWNEVDVYPSFTTCDTSELKEERKRCFESTLTTYIFEHLSKQNIIVTEAINDTLRIRIEITDKGNLNILEIDNNKKTQEHIPNIDSLLITSLDSLPKIFPAIKRGNHVKTEFELPVIIQVN